MGHSRIRLFLFEFGGEVQNLVHDDEQVVAAPLRVAGYKLCHDGIDLLNYVHAEKLFKLNLTRCHDGANDLQRRCIELVMADLEVIEEDLDQTELLQDEHECRVALNYD